MSDIVPGSKYLHYKGGTYTVLCEATNEAPVVPVVVYVSMKGRSLFARLLMKLLAFALRSSKVWVRPVHDWKAPVLDQTITRFAKM